MQKMILSSILLLIGAGFMGQLPVVVKAYAYSRSTVPGIRPPVINETDTGKRQADNPFPTTYFLYLETAKGARFHFAAVWIHGMLYRGTLKKVNTPVKLQKATAAVTAGKQKDVLVPKTANDVYNIGDLYSTKSAPVLSDAEKKTVRDNELVFLLSLENKHLLVPVKTITALAPVMGM